MNQYVVPLIVVGSYFAWRWAHGIRIRRTTALLVAEGAAVIDVRSPAEFARGHRVGSLNVPLSELANAPLTVDANRWVIVCCASGTRSAIAKGILRKRGFAKVINGGSWMNVAGSDAS
jgi:rhodanese-related sulfurtransferase